MLNLLRKFVRAYVRMGRRPHKPETGLHKPFRRRRRRLACCRHQCRRHPSGPTPHHLRGCPVGALDAVGPWVWLRQTPSSHVVRRGSFGQSGAPPQTPLGLRPKPRPRGSSTPFGDPPFGGLRPPNPLPCGASLAHRHLRKPSSGRWFVPHHLPCGESSVGTSSLIQGAKGPLSAVDWPGGLPVRQASWLGQSPPIHAPHVAYELIGVEAFGRTLPFGNLVAWETHSWVSQIAFGDPAPRGLPASLASGLRRSEKPCGFSQALSVGPQPHLERVP